MPRKGSKVVESFAPTAGRVLGIVALAIGALILVDVVIEVRSWEGLKIAAITIAVGSVIWMGLVRPGIVAYEHVLILRNFVRDKLIPWHLVTGTAITPALVVKTGDEQHRSVAIVAAGPDRRALRRSAKAAGGGGFGGLGGRMDVGTGTHEVPSPNPKVPALPPTQHTARRIETMAEQFAEKSRGQPGVELRYARIEIAVFVVATMLSVILIIAT